MASLTITNTFVAGTTIVAAQVNTNNTDISGYINARNAGTTDWDFVSSAGLITGKALIRANDGSATTPSFSYTSEVGLGMYKSAAGILGWASGATEKMTMSASSLTSQNALTLTPTTNQIVLGTTNTVTVSSTAPAASRTLTIGDPLADANFLFSEGAHTVNGAFIFTTNMQLLDALSGSPLVFDVSNTSDTASSDAVARVHVGGTSAGDAYVRYGVDGTIDYATGIDNTDGDLWKLSESSAPGTSDLLEAGTTGGTQIKGTTTNDDATAGWVGELIESTTTANSSAAADGVFDDLLSVSLTAGDWDVSGMVYWQANGGTWTQIRGGVSTTSGNSETGMDLGVEQAALIFASSTNVPSTASLSVPTVRFSVASTTTVYLKRMSSYSAGTPRTAGGRISARRVR